MCNFLSFLADEKHHFHHFTHAQRLAKVKFKNGTKPSYDSHASIAEFYGINEDHCNKYEYDPFTDTLTLDQQNMEENREEVIAFVHSINWQDFCGDIEGFKSFLSGFKEFKFMQNNPDFDLSGCKIFDTRNAARHAADDAALDAAWNVALDAAWNVALDAARNAMWYAARNAAYDAARAAAWGDMWYAARHAAEGAAITAARDAADDIAIYCLTRYLCANLPIAQKHIDYINKRYAIWLNGYGVLCDINGTFYIYRRP